MKCDNCTNGNHTGTNGTAGCEGEECDCPCRVRAMLRGMTFTIENVAMPDDAPTWAQEIERMADDVAEYDGVRGVRVHSPVPLWKIDAVLEHKDWDEPMVVPDFILEAETADDAVHQAIAMLRDLSGKDDGHLAWKIGYDMWGGA